MFQRLMFASLIGLVVANPASAKIVIDFEELDDFNGGPPPDGTGEYFDGYGADANDDGFSSQGVFFQTGQYGPGWSYSNVNDTTTPGFTNQYAVYTGGGSDGLGGTTLGANYAIANTGSATTETGEPLNGAFINLPGPSFLNSVEITNTTYAARYFRDGLDGFGAEPDPNHQFASGDYFRVSIQGFAGLDGGGAQTGSIEFDLANHEGEELEFIDGWENIDLSSMGASRSLVFQTTSSQISEFIINDEPNFFSDVPAYVAIDNLSVSAVPEPSGLVLLGGLTGLSMFYRRRRRTQVG